MKTLLALAALSVFVVTESHAQEQRVTAKIRQQNAEHNAALEKGLATPPDAAKSSAAATKKDPISDLATAEKAVKFQLNAVKQAKIHSEQVAKTRETLHATYDGKTLDEATHTSVIQKYEAADKEVAASEKSLTTARGAFDILYGKYQRFGGTTDYRAQLPK